MSIGIHVARVGLYTVDANNVRIDKNSESTTINQLKNTKLEFLVIPDAAIPNSSGYPTLKEYLEAEAAANYVMSHMDQTTVITYSQTDINNA